MYFSARIKMASLYRGRFCLLVLLASLLAITLPPRLSSTFVAAVTLTYRMTAHERACFYTAATYDREKLAFYFAVGGTRTYSLGRRGREMDGIETECVFCCFPGVFLKKMGAKQREKEGNGRQGSCVDGWLDRWIDSWLCLYFPSPLSTSQKQPKILNFCYVFLVKNYRFNQGEILTWTTILLDPTAISSPTVKRRARPISSSPPANRANIRSVSPT